MAGTFSTLAVLAYLIFLIDWKELRAVLAQGGWGSAVIYGVLTVLIVSVLTTPGVVPGPVANH
ncbi:MAG: hypothetical protein WDA20_08865 [Desulfuromonadales bacterium]